MARTAIPPITMGSSYAASMTAVTFTASDTVNGNSVLSTGKELIVARNTGGASYTLTLTSVVDAFGRLGTITETLAAGAYRAFGPVQVAGWRQAGNVLWLDGSNAAIEIAVLKLT